MIKQTAQQIATQVAKQTIHESNEFLKSAREQIVPTPVAPKPENPEVSRVNTAPPGDVKQDLSFLNSYKSELDEIRRENLFKELQRKISEGEEVPLENYIKELSFEQREVLKAQMEVIERQKTAAQTQQKSSLPQTIAKRGRNAMMGMFKKKNETHVETRQPPSG